MPENYVSHFFFFLLFSFVLFGRFICNSVFISLRLIILISLFIFLITAVPSAKLRVTD